MGNHGIIVPNSYKIFIIRSAQVLFFSGKPLGRPVPGRDEDRGVLETDVEEILTFLREPLRTFPDRSANPFS